MSLVHLHRHSEYSLLDGIGTNAQYASRAAEINQPALALTDHGTLAGALHHINACRQSDIVPIVGCEVYYRPHRKVQGQKEWQHTFFHLILLAKNIKGWRNLMAITSEAHDTGFYQKPCIDMELLVKYGEGLICGTACLGGWLCQSITKGDDKEVAVYLAQLKKIFGDDLFVEIMPSGIEDQIARNIDLINVANDQSLMVCATNDAHAPYKEWVDTQDILLMISTNQSVAKREAKRLAEEDVFEFKDPSYYLMSEEEMREAFAANHPQIPTSVIDQSISNTLVIASKVTPWVISKADKLPRVKRDKPADEILLELCRLGMERIGKVGDAQYEERLEFELRTFEEHGVIDYFILVWEIVNFAKSKGIMVGPGRGSAAGSLVAYLTGITGLDPIPYKLLFERFLNPHRRGLPDIDIDFPTGRVEEIEEYLVGRWGRDRVVDIISHQTFGPKAAISDVARVLSIPFPEIKEVTKTIDDDERAPLEEIRVVNKKVSTFAENHPVAWEHAKRLQGQVARKSEHAAGVLITPRSARELIPLERIGGMDGKLITAWGERAGKGNAIISDYGFNKVDLLRLAELDKQQMAVELIKETTGDEIDLSALEVHKDPYAVEPEVMKAFADGLLVGIFQFAATAKGLTRRIKPSDILELAAINALIRPGPRGAGSDQRFYRRKHGEEPLALMDTTLAMGVMEPFLGYTYGELVFQEQLIEVVHHLGGLSRADADVFRKIASKLYREPEYAKEVMGQWEIPIKEGFRRNGLSEDVIDTIWSNLLEFTDYSFNLAHAAGYALLAYRGMWLKIHYPRQFYAAFLSVGLSRIKEKRQGQKQESVREARLLGLKIMPPDVNESGTSYTVVEGGIRLGLESIKNVGGIAAKELIAKRPFETYLDLESKVKAQKCNRKVKASLVMAGACDRWGMRQDLSEEQVDEAEREFLGISLTSGYSLDDYIEIIESRIHTEDEFDAMDDGEFVTVAGEIMNVKQIKTKNSDDMAFVDLGYGPNEWSCTFFPGCWHSYIDLLESKRPIIVRGEKSTYNGRSSIVVEDAMDLEELRKMLEAEKKEEVAA